MNLSRQKKVREIEIKDNRFPAETFVHRVRPYTTKERIEYNRTMSTEMGLKMKDVEGGELNQDMTLAWEGDPLKAALDLYDSIIQNVEGYEVDKEDSADGLLMSMENWRDMIPDEHKQTVVQILMPSVKQVKN